MSDTSRETALRVGLMATGMLALLGGLWGGLLRLGWAGPLLQNRLPILGSTVVSALRGLDQAGPVGTGGSESGRVVSNASTPSSDEIPDLQLE